MAFPLKKSLTVDKGYDIMNHFTDHDDVRNNTWL